MDSQDERNIEEKQKFFDRHAASWDKKQGEKDESLRALVKDMDLKPDDLVIEPGCGTGLFSAILLEHLGDRGKLYGVDISKEMLDQAEIKGFGPRVSFHHADASRLPFPEDFADAVVCFRAFPHYSDKPGALSEFNRVLKEGGLLVIAHPAGREKINEIHTRAGGEVADDMLPDKGDMRKLLEKAGFDLVSLEDRNDRYLLRAGKSG
jgi:ubiquinone/menaquinone biosynthesis C-methylase UbiE